MANLALSDVFPSISTDEKTGSVSLSSKDLTNAPLEQLNPASGNYGLLLRGVVEKGFEAIDKLETGNKPKGYSIVKNSDGGVPGTPNSRRISYLVTFDMTAPADQFSLISE